MSSRNSSTSDKKSSDTASVLSSSTTSSMSTLLKKFTPKSSKSSKSSKPDNNDDDLSPGEKQAKRQAGRTSAQTLATWASMREKAARIIDRPGEDDVLDLYAARRGTMFLRAGSL